MLHKKIIGLLMCLGVVLMSVPSTQAQENGKRLVLNLVGEGTAVAGFVPDPNNIGGMLPAQCYDVDLFNAKNGQLIGTATDCLSSLTPTGGGVALIGTTTFRLPQGNITTQGRTTVQAAVTPITTTNGDLITHITGASAAGNGIIDGTRRFNNATGTVRLSGLVNLNNHTNMPGGSIFFDCLFVIDLD